MSDLTDNFLLNVSSKVEGERYLICNRIHRLLPVPPAREAGRHSALEYSPIMNFACLLVLALLTGGCSGIIHLSSGGPPHPAPPGSSVAVGPPGVHGNFNTNAGVVFGIALLNIMGGGESEYASRPRDATRADQPPAEDRKINVQDCTRPVDYSLGNLSCK